HAAAQDYSDIAATNPFDSDDESDSTADTCFSEAADGVLTESPIAFVVESSAGLPSKLPGDKPRVDLRFEFDEAGLGLGIGVPGEMMEETYQVLEGRLPVLVDRRASARAPLRVDKRASARAPLKVDTTLGRPTLGRPTLGRPTLGRPTCYELY
ncbi:hypothetical protein IMZ48_48840, partial [Candidatus Bathyarchaeota archaeon]|nr:hypothetical protein [Candidatus Bathyarchaeota archaeon]